MQQCTLPPASISLFSSLDTWTTNPQLAYASWLSSTKMSDRTTKHYLWMFNAFLRYLESENVAFLQTEAEHIEAYLSLPDRSIASRARQQYVYNLEQVFDHLSTLGFKVGNPARVVGLHRLGGGKDSPTRFLVLAERAQLVAFIKTRLDVLSRDEKGKTGKGNEIWTEIRDLALLSIVFGAGMKVGTARRLMHCCIEWEGKHVRFQHQHLAYLAPLLDFAENPLRLWISTLENMTGQAPLAHKQPLFISKKSGFGKFSKSPTMSESSIFRRVERLLGLAGITGDRASPQTLRNTYAAIRIEQGATLEELAHNLGLATTEHAWKLRSACRMANCQMEPFVENDN